MTSRRAILTDRSSFQPVLHDWCNQREIEREMFYLTTHSTHFIYGYMASDIWLRTILIVRNGVTKAVACGMEHIKEPLLLIEKSSQWVVGSIVHGGPIELFLVPVLHDWCNQGRGMCYQNGP